MARFFDPEAADGDARLFAPATERNRDAIRDTLIRVLPQSGTMLEIASGTGQHASYIAPALDGWTWIASDREAERLASIDAWNAYRGAGLPPARLLDVADQPWPLNGPVDAILACNLIHIAPTDICQQLIAGAATHLVGGGLLILYGPFRIGGAHTSPSNADFDASLKSSDPEWGVRDLEWVIDIAEQNGFIHRDSIAMPANNFTQVFQKT